MKNKKILHLLIGVFSLALMSCGSTVTLNHYLHYQAGQGGSVIGDTVQIVLDGRDGTVVTADPNDGYHFVSWSDGITEAERIDARVHGNVDVKAVFEVTL